MPATKTHHAALLSIAPAAGIGLGKEGQDPVGRSAGLRGGADDGAIVLA